MTSQTLSVDTSGDVFQLGSRFTQLQILGCGGNGVVVSAHDETTHTRVAVKRITFSERCTAKRALREIRLMRKLCHENIVKIKDILSANGEALDVRQSVPNCVELKQVCIVEELLDTNLHNLIRAKLLTPAYAKLFVYQILRGLKYMHSANIVHRDLKPSNILVNCEQLTVKISDFGLCRVLDPHYDHAGYLTERVGTCWYLSPEQILTPRDYSKAVDVWSVGCVFAEMLLGRPVFTGANELSQMLLILDSIHLEEDDWCRVLRVMPNKLLKNHPFRPRTPLAERLSDIYPPALDLLEKLLTFDPTQRSTAQEALRHPYLSEYCNREPRAQCPLSVEHEVEPTSPSAVQQLIIQEASRSQPITCGAMYTPPASPTPLSASAELNRSMSSVGSCDESRNTHTLDEILHIDEQAQQRGSISDSSSSSVEDLNMKNLRRSHDNVHDMSQSILNLSQEQLNNMWEESHCFKPDVSNREQTCDSSADQNESSVTENLKYQHHIERSKLKCKHQDSEDEKEIAEPSLRKIVEDKELETSYITPDDVVRNDTTHHDETVRDQILSTKQQLYVQIDTDQTENFKEFSQVSPKERNNNSGGQTHSSPSSLLGQTVVTPRTPIHSGARSRGANQNASFDLDDESAKERKLLEFENENYSKFEAESQENEKDKKRRGNNQASDLDEMYRLPTEHLRIDRDYSNERIKHKRLTKVQQRHVAYLALYRDELNELNERLKEASSDGAVGGEDLAHDVTQEHITVSNISITPPGETPTNPAANVTHVVTNLHRELGVMNNQRVGGGRHRTGDGFSSPEEHPSSPRASFSAGARPKKSPRKQKAL